MLALSLGAVAPSSAGAETKHAPRHMPNVVGLTRAQVYATMKADQLYFRTRGPGSSTGRWVSVVAQSPRPGTLVAWHAEVTLTTSLSAVHRARRVPRLTGLSKSAVFAAMRKAQLYFRTVGPGSSTGTWVVVRRQSPAAGTRVAWHATVLLSVSTHRATTPIKVRPPQKKPVATTTTTVRRTTTTTTTTSTTTTVPVTTTTYPGETTTSTSSVPTTTTTSAPVTTTTRGVTTTTIKKAALRYRIGVATWYSYVPGHCATWYLPFGTRIVVRDLDTGRSVTCIVTDREAAHGNRVVDLAETEFAQLAPLSVGVIRVKVSW